LPNRKSATRLPRQARDEPGSAGGGARLRPPIRAWTAGLQEARARHPDL